jgi:hypothetical protein
MTNTIWDPNIGNVANPSFGTVTAQSLTAAAIAVGAMTDSASGIPGKTDYCQRLSLPVTAITNTDFIMSLPAGSTLLSMTVYTTTAYTGTTANISVGNAAAGAQYVTAVSIASVGMVTLTLLAAQTAAFLSMPAPPNLFIRIAQSTTPTAVGAAVLVVNYLQA